MTAANRILEGLNATVSIDFPQPKIEDASTAGSLLGEDLVAVVNLGQRANVNRRPCCSKREDYHGASRGNFVIQT